MKTIKITQEMVDRANSSMIEDCRRGVKRDNETVLPVTEEQINAAFAAVVKDYKWKTHAKF